MAPDPSANFCVPPSLPSGCVCVKTLGAPSSTLSACGFQSRPPFLSLPPDADTALWVWGPQGHGAGRAVSPGCPVSSGRPRAPQTGGRRLPAGPKVGAVCRSSSSRLAPREGWGLVPLGQLRKPAWAGEASPAGIRCALLGARPGPAQDTTAVPTSLAPGVSGSWGPWTRVHMSLRVSSRGCRCSV